MHDSLILKVFYNNKGLNYIIFDKFIQNLSRYSLLFEYISYRYNDALSIEEIFFRLKHNIEEKPVCPTCGKPVPCRFKPSKPFQKYCNNSCRGKDPINNKKWVEGQHKYNLEHYGVEHNFQRVDCINKRSNTLSDKYGTTSVLAVPQFKEKKEKTMERLFGVKHAMQNIDIKQHRVLTHVKNGTNTSSKQENIVFELLSIFYHDVKRNYSSDKYPFNCDFYIPSKDLYIEYNGSHYHHGHPFNTLGENDKKELERLQNLSNSKNQYNKIIYTWTDLDVRKRNTAKENNLNFIEFWNIEDVKQWLGIENSIRFKDNLTLKYDNLINELNYYKTNTGKLSTKYVNSKLIKQYQQDVFYKTEKQLWKTNENSLRSRLINNRLQYLNIENENDITAEIILNGFKRSGIYYGYSSFNPLWIKWFLEEFNINICYDPCGGWGHRLLGSQNIKQYIYNDLSKPIVNNVKTIIKDFNINNVIIYNNDASEFIPKEDYEAIFTCPPYFNTEIFPCGKFEDNQTYFNLIDGIFKSFYEKESCRIMGLVLREDCLQEKYLSKIFEKHNLSIQRSHISKGKKTKQEYLYIFKK